MRPPTVHIVFGPMAAASLETAIRQAGREDRVACHQDKLAVGPIYPPEPQARSAWINKELPPAGASDEGFPDDTIFWKEALRADLRKVAWMSRRRRLNIVASWSGCGGSASSPARSSI